MHIEINREKWQQYWDKEEFEDILEKIPLEERILVLEKNMNEAEEWKGPLSNRHISYLLHSKASTYFEKKDAEEKVEEDEGEVVQLGFLVRLLSGKSSVHLREKIWANDAVRCGFFRVLMAVYGNIWDGTDENYKILTTLHYMEHTISTTPEQILGWNWVVGLLRLKRLLVYSGYSYVKDAETRIRNWGIKDDEGKRLDEAYWIQWYRRTKAEKKMGMMYEYEKALHILSREPLEKLYRQFYQRWLSTTGRFEEVRWTGAFDYEDPRGIGYRVYRKLDLPDMEGLKKDKRMRKTIEAYMAETPIAEVFFAEPKEKIEIRLDTQRYPVEKMIEKLRAYLQEYGWTIEVRL